MSDNNSDMPDFTEPSAYNFHPDAKNTINSNCFSIIDQIELITISKDPSNSFKSHLPGAVVINAEDVVDSLVLSDIDSSGRYLAKIFIKNEQHFCIRGESYKYLRLVSERIAKVPWVRDFLGQPYIEEALFSWCREQYFLKEKSDFTDFISNKAINIIKEWKVYVPIALMQVEESFEFGSVNIISITSEILNERKQACINMLPNEIENANNLFDDIARKIQGLAAVSISLSGESGHVKSEAYRIAKDVVGLIRLYSSASFSPWIFCPCTPLGAEIAPAKTTLSYSTTDFCFSEGSATPNLRRWQLSIDEISLLQVRGLNKLSRLLLPSGLSKFQQCVRSSLLSYSHGISLPDISDRLIYSFSALESLLIKDSSEPIQQNLGERLAFLISSDPSTRQSIAKNMRDAYALRSRYIHHQIKVSDEDTLDQFILSARAALFAAVDNMDNFPTKLDFINGIDDIKFGH